MDDSLHLNRKLQRAIASRKEAERLLEEKSLELYQSNQQLKLAMKQLELKSEQQLFKFEFEQQIDDTLITFGRVFIVDGIDDLLLANLLERLSRASVIRQAWLKLDKPILTTLKSLEYGLKPTGFLYRADDSRTRAEWFGDALCIPIILESEYVGSMVFTIDHFDIDLDFISNQLCLIADLVSNALNRQLWMERETELRKRAEESEKATKEFVAMINHELRTPLNGVLGSAELLGNTYLNDEQQLYLRNLRQGGELLRVIINDLLDFSKMNAGMMEIVPKVFRWQEVEESIVGIFAAKASEKQIGFHIEKQFGMPRCVCGDVERIKQILVNLIGNAIKFTQQGAVTFRTHWQDDVLSVEIEDTGIGIAEQAKSTLFDPFVQADRSSKRNYEGSGLGLAICRNLCRLMGGEIGFRSELGKGSCFHFAIPLPASDEPLLEPHSEQVERHQLDWAALKVLVVDDIRMNQVIINQMLKKLQVTPEVRNNGVEALQAVSQQDYDLIFMDCRMPEMDGYEATHYLREQGLATPIVALTAGTTLEEREKCLVSGMNDILTKPYTADDVERMMLKWLTVKT
ncbi:TPA: response regulator [Vibrio vulnificus]|nr:response regulator [Vibrio vulnificus]